MASFKLGDDGSDDNSPQNPSPKQSRFKVNVVSEDPSSDPGSPETTNHKLAFDDNSMDQSMQMHTLGQMTMEAKPSIENYRNLFSVVQEPGMKSRPTLQDLHDPKPEGEFRESPSGLNLEGVEEGTPTHQKKAVKFGWIKGVLVRCLLNIWGVMLFLRLSWVVGQAGIVCATCIVLLSAVVTCLTTISMSAICTNGEVKGGGAYYMISRSLGPEFGGSIGLIFSMANAVAVAMYVVGFAETVRDVLEENDFNIIGHVHDVRLIGEVTLVLILCIALIGTAWEARAQIILLAILLLSIINMVAGSFLYPTDEKRSKGFVGYDADTFKSNFGPAFKDGYNFISVFSIFFPAATGILAGANISGDLRDAQKAIPKGTFLAIGLSSVVYSAIAWLFGAVLVKQASGITEDVDNGNYTSVCYEEDMECKFGLLNDYQASRLIAVWGPLVLAGIFSATLSSALASMVSAPKVFQAVCKDKIFPKIDFFAVGSGPSDEPKRAYFLTFFIAAAFTAIGTLDAIAPLISNFFLMSYALINFSCFSASLAQSPGWRPAFKYYNMWVALMASAMCVAVMFLINWWAALITIAVIAALYAYVHHTKPEINWGSSTQAFIYKRALDSTLQLNHVPDHIKTFRPQILVLSGEPDTRPALLRFVNNITKNNSLLLVGNVIQGDQERNISRLMSDSASTWLANQKIKAFPARVTATSLRLGVQSLLQLGGLGKIKPNLVVLGFKNDWATAKEQEVEDYVGIIHDSFDMHLGVAVFRIKEGFDVSSALPESGITKKMRENSKVTLVTEAEINIEISDMDENKVVQAPLIDSTALIKCQPKEVIKSVQLFQGKGPKGQIHVWWLFDDGGLTLLVPYLLTIKSHWEKCTLKIFTGGKKDQLNKEKQNMASLLNKFRIDHEAVEIIPGIGKAPKKESYNRFQEKIKPLKLDTSRGETPETHPWKITEEELEELKDKTNRQIRLQELLFEHSKEAQLIVMSLPMPRKKSCSPYLYMSWLETLSQDLPPMLLMRGNQTSVLTYYS